MMDIVVGILGKNTKDITINNSYSICELQDTDTWKKGFGGIVGSNTGTDIIINKCYYLKKEKATQAVNGVEDSTLDVVQCTSVAEITAETLNANINTIEHDVEWRKWMQGEKYPVFIE